MTNRVEVCTPDEARRIIANLTRRDEPSFHLEGFVDLVWRNALTGEVEDEIHQPNLITDFGRRSFVDGYFLGGTVYYLFTSPSTEDIDIARSSLIDPTGAQASSASGAYTSATLTRTWSVTFAAPGSTLQIGTVGLKEGAVSAENAGAQRIVAMTRLNPAKQQTTTQTLELQYRITLVPIFY